MAAVYPTFLQEQTRLNRGVRCVGVDEVGRGCLAGPVVTAAVVFPDSIVLAEAVSEKTRPLNKAKRQTAPWWRKITDSKLLKPDMREFLSQEIWTHCQVQVSWCDAEDVDKYNILRASLRAMRASLWPFQGLASTVLVDGHIDPYRPQFGAVEGEATRLGFTEIVPLVKGDQKSISIAAASIVAKVFRDQWMNDLHEIFPQYGLDRHKGYPTPDHQRFLREFGLTPLHRRSFSLDKYS